MTLRPWPLVVPFFAGISVVASACGQSERSASEHAPGGVVGGGAGAGAGGSGGSAAGTGGTGGSADAGATSSGGSSGAGAAAGSGGSSGAAQSTGGAGGAAAGRGGASSAGRAGAAGGGVVLPTPCENAEELAPGGGFERCDNGLVHRPSVGVCPTYQQRSETFGPSEMPAMDECFMDADCDEKPLGYCVKGFTQYAVGVFPNRCAYACTVDADCDTGTLCLCSAQGGTCTGAASCTSDADCTGGGVCAAFPGQCLQPVQFSCQTRDDECEVYEDCPSGLSCQSFQGGSRRCTLPPCAG